MSINKSNPASDSGSPKPTQTYGPGTTRGPVPKSPLEKPTKPEVKKTTLPGVNPAGVEDKVAPKTPKERQQQKVLEQKQTKLQKAIKDQNNRLKRVFSSIAQPLRDIAAKIVNAEEDPQEVLAQVQDLLKINMKIPLNKVQHDKVSLYQKAGVNSVYYIPLRRDFILDNNMIPALNRNVKHFNALTWSTSGPELWIQYPYVPPVTDEKAPAGVKMPKI